MNAPSVSPPFVRGPFRIAIMTIIATFLAGLFTVGFESAGIIVTLACAFAFVIAFTRFDFLASKFSSNATKTIFGISALFSALMYFTPRSPDPDQPSVSAGPAHTATTSKIADPAKSVPTDVSSNTKTQSQSNGVGARPLPETAAETPPSTAVAVKEVSTTVDELLQTYEDNQIAGNKIYGNAKITISGRVVRVREAFGTGILVLRSRRPDNPLELYFAQSGNDSLSAVSPGQSVEAVCYTVVELMGAVALGDCKSVK